MATRCIPIATSVNHIEQQWQRSWARGLRLSKPSPAASPWATAGRLTSSGTGATSAGSARTPRPRRSSPWQRPWRRRPPGQPDQLRHPGRPWPQRPLPRRLAPCHPAPAAIHRWGGDPLWRFPRRVFGAQRRRRHTSPAHDRRDFEDLEPLEDTVDAALAFLFARRSPFLDFVAERPLLILAELLQHGE